MPKKIIPAAQDTWAVYIDPDGNARRYLVIAWTVDEKGTTSPVGAIAEPGSGIAPHAWIWTPGAGRAWNMRPTVPKQKSAAVDAAKRATIKPGVARRKPKTSPGNATGKDEVASYP